MRKSRDYSTEGDELGNLDIPKDDQREKRSVNAEKGKSLT
jgi:hypothetical protein